MLSLGPLAFASPWLLAALIALPAIWFLVRATPPTPRRVIFPAMRLLFGLEPREETPARTPWWLLLLRLTAAALVILALAHPLIGPRPSLPGQGPALILIDDGWAMARYWPETIARARAVTEAAEREGRPVMLMTTAPTPGGETALAPRALPAAEIRARLEALEPKPWPVDRAATTRGLAGLDPSPDHVTYLADGLGAPPATTDAPTVVFALLERLQTLGALDLETPPPSAPANLILGPAGQTVTIKRYPADQPGLMFLRALGRDGRLIDRREIRFAAGEASAAVELALPLELRNAIARLDLEGPGQVGAVVLLDEGWRRQPVGIVTPTAEAGADGLLDDQYYLTRALAPFAEVHRGPLDDVLRAPLAMLLVPDGAASTAEDRAKLERFMSDGGALVRFAGKRLAGEGGRDAAAEARSPEADSLLPVRLRPGGRTLGSAMQWSEPARLAPFDENSPFAGLTVPNDVTVSRQLLAEPAIDLAEHSWARLVDGTPLVTAARRGAGWLVLVHVPATPSWSTLPLSGLFVDMLRRLTNLGTRVATAGEAPSPPFESLDGHGRLGAAPATAAPLEAARDANGRPVARRVDARHPPGYYGNDTARVALNLTAATVTGLEGLGPLPTGVTARPMLAWTGADLKPPLLAVALVLLLVDMLVGLALRGLLTRRVAGLATLALALFGGDALAQGKAPPPPDRPIIERPSGTLEPADAFALDATLETRLAYVVTGVPLIDATSRAGLKGLSTVLARRTAVEAVEPLAVDPESDELAFFPLLYWPVSEEQADLSAKAIAKLNAYLRGGGTILFDTRDADATLGAGVGPGQRRLRTLTRGLDIPPLMEIPPDHVLSRAFYLLSDFPGRSDGGRLWVEARDNPNDEVSSVLVTANDLAGAWAIDPRGRPLYPATPGGEQQREMAYRFGVNLVMYALTGNYKTDQVHVSSILERLGQ